MAEVDGLNAGYARAVLEEYLENPEAVPAEWRELFEGDSTLLREHPGVARLLEVLEADGNGAQAEAAPPPPAPAAEPTAPPPPAPVDETLLAAVAAAVSLVKAYRTHGHLAARLDPLGSEPVGDPALEPERLVPPLTPELQAQIPARLLRVHVPGETLADVLPKLQETYCGTSAYEIEHISDHQERVWLRQAIESGTYSEPLEADDKRRLLARLSEVEGLERYLRKAFLGQKQFSIEGLDVMVPMLDLALELAAEDGAHEVVTGMAHRGRLNVLAHLVGRPYEVILREFEGERNLAAISNQPAGASGDVKYHLGAEGRRKTAAGDITVTLAANPSHLEAVDPVVEGLTRSEQTDRSTRGGDHDPRVALPVLIHGDASFPGQGVVAETLNLQSLGGYSTGGTLHVIANNQVGFTTDPADGRSTRYSSDLAKGFDVPIIHVNADDPEAAVASIRLAMAFRRRFGRDVVIDLIGYRRWGHNEGDEPAYTQPLMAERIKEQPSVREQYAAQLADEGVVTQEEADELAREVEASLKAAHETLKTSLAEAVEEQPPSERTPSDGGRRGSDRRRGRPAQSAERGAPARPRPLHRPSEARAAAPAAPRSAGGRRDRLGPRRGARVCEPARGRDPGQAHRAGHRARDVRAAPPRPPRSGKRRAVHADEEPRRRFRLVRGVQLAAVRVRDARLRIRLFGRRAGGARALGGAVRRLRQRRADRHRPVHRLGPVEVEPDFAPHAAAAARVRGQRARALERPAGALPAARGPGEHPHRHAQHGGAVLPSPPPAGARSQRPPAGRHDAEGAPAS